MHVAADLTESPTHTSVTETEATTAKTNGTEMCITGIYNIPGMFVFELDVWTATHTHTYKAWVCLWGS